MCQHVSSFRADFTHITQDFFSSTLLQKHTIKCLNRTTGGNIRGNFPVSDSDRAASVYEISVGCLLSAVVLLLATQNTSNYSNCFMHLSSPAVGVSLLQWTWSHMSALAECLALLFCGKAALINSVSNVHVLVLALWHFCHHSPLSLWCTLDGCIMHCPCDTLR